MSGSLLLHPKMVYKFDHGFDYPQFFDYYEKAVASVWRHQEVSLEADLRDWQQNMSEAERKLIAGVLRGFTSAEIGIGCYWGGTVCRIFPKPEIQAMARMFSAFEQIHAAAYNYLSDTLGLNEFEEFISDPIAKAKVERFFTDCNSDAVSLAVFSGAGEGVSLYSSFAILLAFSKDGRLKGLAQIISWSCLDEAQHSNGGSELFRELVKEIGISEQEKKEIEDGFNTVIKNEFSFLDSIFGHLEDDTIPIAIDEIKAYIKLRANDRLANLDLDITIPMTDNEKILAQKISDWFDPIVKGQINHDFFARSKAGDSYISKPSQDFASVDLASVDFDIDLTLA